MYECETWSLTLQEEHRLTEFENRVLRRIFGYKSENVTGNWRKLHNEELHNLYLLPDIIRLMSMRWVRHVALMGEMRNMYILVGIPEGKKTTCEI
jgi:hypothetical protein